VEGHAVALALSSAVTRDAGLRRSRLLRTVW
jgi:hypothetical protein